MILEVFVSDRLCLPKGQVAAFHKFVQGMANRLGQGHGRYGTPRPDKRYMGRMIAETKAYKKAGNREQLLNLSVYATLEDYCPEHPKYHQDSTVPSVTRGKGF